MTPIRVNSQEGITTEWGGVRHAASLPTKASDASTSAAGTEGSTAVGSNRRSVAQRAMRFVRDAVIGLALVVSIPLAVIGYRGDVLWYDTSGVSEKLTAAEAWRPLMGAKDPTITPMQAGEAYRRLQQVPQNAAFPMRGEASTAPRIWETQELSPEMFAEIRSPFMKGPSAMAIVEHARSGFSAQELAYLREVAESPLWRDFDMVASAKSVDIIGGQYVLPFRGDAFAPAMPIPRFSHTKELAYAGVSRAAYYVAIGEPQRAEAALQSVMAYGFALIDNGSTAIEALIGRVVADIGRNGLHQFYTMNGDVNRARLTALDPGVPSAVPMRARTRSSADIDAIQARLLAHVRDPGAPRSMRIESLRQLSVASTCGSMSGVLRGPSADVRAAISDAQRLLVRYPSEREYLDMVLAMPKRLPAGSSDADRFLTSVANVAGIAINQPMVAACARVVLAYD
jgi:hypothetical protein